MPNPISNVFQVTYFIIIVLTDFFRWKKEEQVGWDNSLQLLAVKKLGQNGLSKGLEARDEVQTECLNTDECTKRIDRQTDESNDGESNSSASGVKAFPYEPGFKILGCQKNSHTWHNVRNRPNAFNCNSASFSSSYKYKSLSAFKQT